ncbi:entericidin A/B family lipoprotein [Nitrosomonas sp. Is37]|nr:entericidin A/B family lipoprotein [Nitrosomonas sp. Is37]MDV6343696.1 entericidin A/B family lipoprotein [Nitrosomonas sp. Is37]
MKMISVSIGLLWIALRLTGCHTMQGLGKDIESGGKAIEKSAQ